MDYQCNEETKLILACIFTNINILRKYIQLLSSLSKLCSYFI